MKTNLIIVSLILISSLTQCQEKGLSPNIEGTYSVNAFDAKERYGDLGACIVCGPRDIFPSKATLIKSNDIYDLEIKGIKHPNPFDVSKRGIDKEEYSHLFKNITIKTDDSSIKLFFKEQLIGSIENDILKISNLIFEVGDKPNPIVDTKYISITAKK